MSENDEHGNNTRQASEGCTGKMDSWKAEEEKEEDVEEEEDEDTDFNPCLIAEEEVSEASSSLSSEDEDSADHSQRHSLVHLTKQSDEAAGESINIGFIQDGECKNTDQRERRSVSIEDSGRGNLSVDETRRDSMELVTKIGFDRGDAICMRTRARHSLADYSLEELETFLQESDDDDDLQHVNDEEEYRKFLSAVLSSGDDPANNRDINENLDEDEENDADFEIEIEEALDSDAEENNRGSHDWKENKMKDRRGIGTRQKRTQRASMTNVKNNNIPLRPILPTVPNTRLDSMSQSQGWHPSHPQMIPNFPSTAEPTRGFTSQQIGQLFCLVNEHVQLLIQVFSISIHDPTKQQVASEVQSLFLEMSDKREEALNHRKVPYPVYCFDFMDSYHSINVDPSRRVNSQWAPPVSSPMLSILDVKPLAIGKKYIEDVSASILRYKRDQVEGKHVRSQLKKEPLFPLQNYDVAQETTAEVIDVADTAAGSVVSSVSFAHVRPKKTPVITKVEKTKELSIALVPSDIASLAQTFSTLFNPSFFPLKPPPPAVANRALFTDSEDGLLAMGLMEYNNDWRAIQQRFLPCKSEHQIFVRQKNRASSKAPENPIKAVRRMKTSPLSAEEKVLITEGLKVFKHEWISVWRYFVPHRDPSLLPRQWRIATGTQKSYRKDESMNEKRRLYEAQRRKSKATSSGWNPMASEHEIDDPENEDEAYVHEAFLADNENLGYEDQDSINLQINGFLQSSKSMDQQIVNPSVPSSRQQVHYPYRMRKRKGAQVVKLAPELPPVNLPPSVRIISQSAFRNHPSSSTLSTTDKVLGKVTIPRMARGSKSDISGSSTLQERRDSGSCETDMQLHPLLFQMGDADVTLYRSTAAVQQPTLKIPRLGSERSNLTGVTMDFHPLFLKTDGQHTEPESPPDKSQPRDSSIMLHDKDGEIELVSDGRRVVSGISGSRNMLDSGGQLFGQREDGVAFELPDCSEERDDPASIEIVMEHEELSDSEEEVDDVEFECEEMDDSEGEDVDAESAIKCIGKE